MLIGNPGVGMMRIEGWNLANASYASKMLDATGHPNTTRALALSPDGINMYISDSANIYQYTLSTPNDVSTASYASKSLAITVSGVDAGLALSADGTKIYAASGGADDRVFQYDMSTAYDLSTAVYNSKFISVNAQSTTTTGVKFSRDGTKMYVLDNATDTVYQYALSTPNDVSTATYASKSFSVNAQDATPRDLAFKPDGTAMYISGDTNNKIFQYSLSTAGDVSTATYASKSLDVSSQTTAPDGLFISLDGTKLYLGLQSSNVYVYQYNVGP